MVITYDPRKRVQTLADRQLDFEDAKIVFEGANFETEDIRKNYGESRTICFGPLEDRMVVVGYTPRGADRHVFREALNTSAPCAARLLRDEAQGAKPKASLHGLPGFETQRIARKTTPPKGFGQKQALCPPNRLRVPRGTRRAVLADKSSCF